MGLQLGYGMQALYDVFFKAMDTWMQGLSISSRVRVKVRRSRLYYSTYIVSSHTPVRHNTSQKRSLRSVAFGS